MKIVNDTGALNQAHRSIGSDNAVALAIIDKMNFVGNLVKASTIAASSLEDEEQRDAFTALNICIEEKLAECVRQLRASFVK